MTTSSIMSGPLQTERRPDGNRRLLRALEVKVGDSRIRVPASAVTDFSSIPWFARFLVRWSKVDVAGVVHDRLYATHETSRARADEFWRVIARSGAHSANAFQAWTCWLGLRAFGWFFWYRERTGHRTGAGPASPAT